MRKRKRFLAIALAACLAAGSLPAGMSRVSAETGSGRTNESTENQTESQWDSQVYNTDYFGDQLTEEAEKAFYAALKEMYENDEFVDGTVSHEIPVGNEEGMISSGLLEKYKNGDASLLQMFQNASNAFMLDRNDLFYVDWTKLSVRVGQTSSGWSVRVGNGAYKNLYLAQYQDQKSVEADNEKMSNAIKTIADEADKLQKREEKVGYVHDALIEKIEYVYRGTTKVPGDTAAGGLVYGRAWCEGYARAFKAVMDQLNIPCVLVGGTGLPEAAQNGESLISPDVEAHMWNYVCMNDGKWYAVDVTYDDPITQKPGDAIRRGCLLKGSEEFGARHVESGQFSQGGRSFQYPVISKGNVGEGDGNGEGLKVDVSYYDAEGWSSDYLKREWTSYTVMRPVYTDAKGESFTGGDINRDGHYLYYKYKYVDSKGEPMEDGDWTNAMTLFGFEDGPEITKSFCTTEMIGEKSRTQVGCQFAVADKKAQTDNASDPSFNRLPDGANILATSEVIYFRDRYKDIRVVKPSIIDSKPYKGSCITADSVDVKYVYDMPLKLAEGYSEASLKVSTSLSGPSYRVENLTWKNTTREGFDGRVSDCCEVEFKFYPDTSYNYSGTNYTFELEGLVSLANGTQPRGGSLTWKSTAVNKYPCPYMPAPSEMLMSMYPRLAHTTYSPELFTDPLGNGLAGTNNYDLNLTLIASKPSSGEQQKMEDALENAGVQPAKDTAVFNLDLSLSCLSMRTMLNSKLNEGKTKISMALPYPEGFDSRKLEGVTFEAYHFRKDESGKYVPEKLICNATDTGIWVIAESFSPFAVVAVNKDDQVKEKMISAVTNAEMADITVTRAPSAGDETLFPEIMELTEGQSCTYTVTPKEGYKLEQVIWNGVEQKVTTQADGSYTVTYNWKELTEENNSLQVNFCAAEVLEAEKTEGFVVENPTEFNAGMAGNNGQETLPTASAEEKFDASKMKQGKTVTAEMENTTEVKLNTTDLKLKEGETGELKLTEGGSTKNTWESSQPAVATVDNDGTVTAVKVGTSYLTVTNANGSAFCRVDVIAAEAQIVEVENIELNHTEVSMAAGSSPIELTATITPENATNKELSWKNQDSSVASLQDGMLTPLKAGTTTLTVTTPNGKSASCVVTVYEEAAKKITLNKTELSLEAGATETLTATVEPAGEAVIWSSSDTNVAEVTDDGVVTAVAAGNATLTATAGGISAVCYVTVTGKAPEKLTVTVENGVITNKSNQTQADFDPRGIVRVAPTETEGIFICWKNKDTGAVVSYNKNYAFVATESIFLTAVFADQPVEKEAFITLDSRGTITVTGNTRTLSYSGRSYLPTGWKIQEKGIALTNKALGEIEIAGMKASEDDPSVTPLAYVKLKQNNSDQFIIHVTKVKKGATRTARAYMKCIDDKGNTVYVYSTNAVSLTAN